MTYEPCPNCGSKLIGIFCLQTSPSAGVLGSWWQAYCKDCLVKGTPSYSASAATHRWNRHAAAHRLALELFRAAL